MASSDYERPLQGTTSPPRHRSMDRIKRDQAIDSTAPPHGGDMRNTWTGPLGIALAVVFVVLLLMALLG